MIATILVMALAAGAPGAPPTPAVAAARPWNPATATMRPLASSAWIFFG